MNHKELILKAAKDASKILVNNFGKIKEITAKSENNFVTNVDIEAEKAIFDVLKPSGYDILSEETPEIKNDSEYKWIIDPLDGTHNFIHGLPLFGVSIALEHKKEIILGVITIPMLGQTFVAEKGKGALLNEKKISVSDNSDTQKSMLIFDGSIHMYTEKKVTVLKNVSKKISRIRILGAAVSELTSVAMGIADAHIAFSTNPWDVAAGFLIIRESGGRVTDFSGKDADHYTDNFVASNGVVHDQILPFLKCQEPPIIDGRHDGLGLSSHSINRGGS